MIKHRYDEYLNFTKLEKQFYTIKTILRNESNLIKKKSKKLDKNLT